MMPSCLTVKKCCKCLSLRLGSYIIAGIDVVSSTLALLASVIAILFFGMDNKSLIEFGSSLLHSSVATILLRGIKRSQARMILFWVHTKSFLLIATTVLFAYQLAMEELSDWQYSFLFVLPLGWYCIIVVRSYALQVSRLPAITFV